MTDQYIEQIRTSTVLTGSYVAATVLGTNVPTKTTQDYNYLCLEIDFTIGSLTTAEIKVEFSDDGGTTYRQQDVQTASSGGTIVHELAEHQFNNSGKFNIVIHPLSTNKIKVSAKGTGTVTSSLLAIKAILAKV